MQMNDAQYLYSKQQSALLTEHGFCVSFDGTAERLEQYDRNGKALLKTVSGLSGLKSYKTQPCLFSEQYNVL